MGGSFHESNSSDEPVDNGNIFMSQPPQSMVPPGIRVIGVKRPKPQQLESTLSPSKEETHESDHITPRFTGSPTESPLKKPRPNALLELTEAANMVQSGQLNGNGKKVELSAERKQQMTNALSILNKRAKDGESGEPQYLLEDIAATSDLDKPKKIEFHRSESEHKQLLEKANETKDIMQLIQLIEDYKREQKKHNVKWTDVPPDEDPVKSSSSPVYPDEKKTFYSYASVPNHSNHSVDSLLTKPETPKKVPLVPPPFVTNFNSQKEMQDSLRQKLAHHLHDVEMNGTAKTLANECPPNLFEAYMNFMASTAGGDASNSQKSFTNGKGFQPVLLPQDSSGHKLQQTAQPNPFAEASSMFQSNSIRELMFLQQLACFQPEGIKKFLAMLWASRVTNHAKAANSNPSFPVNQFLNDPRTINLSKPSKSVKKEEEEKKELSRQQHEITKRLSVSSSSISTLINTNRPPAFAFGLPPSKSARSVGQKVFSFQTKNVPPTNVVTIQKDAPLSGRNTNLLSDKNKSIIKTSISNKTGKSAEKRQHPGNQLIQQSQTSSSIPLPLLTLTPASSSLLDSKNDKVKNKVHFSNNDVELRKESPGISNDMGSNGQISISTDKYKSHNITSSTENCASKTSTAPNSLQRQGSQVKEESNRPSMMRQPSTNLTFPADTFSPENIEKMSFTLLDKFLSESGGFDFQEGMSFGQKLQAISASFGKNVSFGKNNSFGKIPSSSSNVGSRTASFDKASFGKQFFSAMSGGWKSSSSGSTASSPSYVTKPKSECSPSQDMKIAMPRFSTAKSVKSVDKVTPESKEAFSASKKTDDTSLPSNQQPKKNNETSSKLWKPQPIHHPVTQPTSLLTGPAFNPYGMKPGALDPSMFQGKQNSQDSTSLVKLHNWLMGETPQNICKQDEDGDT